MPALRDLQLAFVAAVLRRDDGAAAAAQLGPADQRLARRLAVYRVNARENFAAALAAAYPVLQLELGAEEFRSMARSYQAAHPSPSGNLFEVGRQLPAFLARTLAGAPEEWLRELARLEWAVQEALVAADGSERFDAGGLARLPPQRYAALRFILHPSVRLLQTAFPVFAAWQAFHAVPAGERRPTGRPAAAPEHLLVHRAGERMELLRLDAAERRALACLAGGGSFGDLTDAALEATPAPDVGAWLARWTACGVITGVVIPGGDSA